MLPNLSMLDIGNKRKYVSDEPFVYAGIYYAFVEQRMLAHEDEQKKLPKTTYFKCRFEKKPTIDANLVRYWPSCLPEELQELFTHRADGRASDKTIDTYLTFIFTTILDHTSVRAAFGNRLQKYEGQYKPSHTRMVKWSKDDFDDEALVEWFEHPVQILEDKHMSNWLEFGDVPLFYFEEDTTLSHMKFEMKATLQEANTTSDPIVLKFLVAVQLEDGEAQMKLNCQSQGREHESPYFKLSQLFELAQLSLTNVGNDNCGLQASRASDLTAPAGYRIQPKDLAQNFHMTFFRDMKILLKTLVGDLCTVLNGNKDATASYELTDLPLQFRAPIGTTILDPNNKIDDLLLYKRAELF